MKPPHAKIVENKVGCRRKFVEKLKVKPVKGENLLKVKPVTGENLLKVKPVTGENLLKMKPAAGRKIVEMMLKFVENQAHRKNF